MQRTLTDIPASDVDEVVQDFASERPTVTKTQQPNGNCTVVAKWPGNVVRTLTDIPTSQVEQVAQDLASQGPTVTKTQQPNGKWTVVATWPD